MRVRKLNVVPRAEAVTNQEPYAELVDCIENFITHYDYYVGDLDNDPQQRGMFIHTDVGDGRIIIEDGAYTIYLQGPAHENGENEIRYECSNVKVQRNQAIVESYTESIIKKDIRGVSLVSKRMSKIKTEELGTKSASGLVWLISDASTHAYRDEGQATYYE